jgi:hypothetical protein
MHSQQAHETQIGATRLLAFSVVPHKVGRIRVLEFVLE